MKILKKKQLHLLIIAALIVLVVIFLYPTGSELLKALRVRASSFESGKEVIYSYFNNGDISVADEILKNKYEISRFDPVVIDKPTWTEDPFSDIYWRFNYYNLEPVRNLLFAWLKTGDSKYKDKLIEITGSFIDNGMNGPYSWDYHGAAFRTMTLIDVREKLLEKDELPADLDRKILGSLKVHGDFLADPAHFEKDYNHGLDQAAALYLLAVNFPDMPGADAWLKLSSQRIAEMLSGIIDDDGVLVENSPYYHLYVLEKFWEINEYLKQYNLTIEGFSDAKIDKMVSYVVYMLQPDLTVPTIGASLQRQINLSGVYAEMAKTHPDLLYILTQGGRGTKPANLNIQYPISGETIMRSGWSKGKDYINQAQLIFDVGNYRTNHSDLDALSFNLYGNGLVLMPDAGLYTYDAGPYRTYFHGTRSHNTVVVDGKDQAAGEKIEGGLTKVYPGIFQQGDGYVYQSGEHELYQGVSHERAITMIEDSTILIFDNLKSPSEHTYEQMFHLFPGAKISTDFLNGLTLKAQGDKPEQSLTIRQFITDGVELNTVIGEQNPPDGLCSTDYKVAVPCYAVSYMQKGQNVSYVTAISIGQDTADINFDKVNNLVTVKTKKSQYNIKINETQGAPRVIEANKNYDISRIYSSVRPADSLNALNEWYDANATNEVGNKTKTESVTVNSKENSLEIIPPLDGSYIEVARDTSLDLSDQNIYFKIKINKNLDTKGIDLYLSNDSWTKEARFNVETVINYQNNNRDGEWLQFGVGKGDLRKTALGNWVKSDPSFDWSKIDSVKFTVAPKDGKNVVVDIKDFSLVPDQKEARAIIVFDDGWSSVMDAAKIMNEYSLKGNVAMITGAVGRKQYLTLDNLKALQNNYGWDIVSHSSLHKNAVNEYVDNNNLKGFDADISDAIQYLVQNNLNSAPDWYIYPDGSTDGAIKGIIDKYYKFARATTVVPEIFPFAEPFEVGVFPVYSDRANTKDVHNAVSDAIKYKQTLFLMFHKFTVGTPTVYTEWQLSEFDAVLKDIKNQGIKVVTLSELDKENGIPQTQFTIHNFVPQQFDLNVSVNHNAN